MIQLDRRYVQTFTTHEARESAFHDIAGSGALRRHLGPRIFLEDLMASRLSQENHFLRDDRVRLCVTSNPRDWLAFRTVREVLDAATAIARNLNPGGDTKNIDEVIDTFLLSDIESLSIHEISEGEAAKVAMAKCFILHESA